MFKAQQSFCFVSVVSCSIWPILFTVIVNLKEVQLIQAELLSPALIKHFIGIISQHICKIATVCTHANLYAIIKAY